MAYRSSVADALAVLADPTRRSIFEALAARPASVGELARCVPVTRPAVSQHLRALKDAGLVTDKAEGTRRIYAIDPRGIGAIRDWLDHHWPDSLARFRALADADRDPRAAATETTSQEETP